MKKLIYSLFAVLMVITSSCKYDDSDLWDSVNNLETRVTNLEALCNQINTNVNSLQTLVYAMQDNDYVTGINPVYEGNDIIGYTISFTKSPTITIYHGKDGQNGMNGTNGTNGKDGRDGQDGYTPLIGVSLDSDGHYYWTLDGEWLLDKNGNRVLAEGAPGKDGQNGTNGTNGKDGQDGQDGINGADGKDGKDGQNGVNGQDGKDGITPKFKIEDGDWYISLDNGLTWQYLGRAHGADGKDGLDGQDGKDGVDGKDGAPGKDGVDGKDGKDGVDGKDGQNGADGAPGKDGVDGKDGQNGLDGKDGQNGKDGRDGQDGRDGDSMFSSIDTSDPDFVIFTLADGTQIKLPTWYAFETLKKYCQQLNTNIQSLQTIVNAMEAGDYIVSTTPLMQDGVEIGYTITFAKRGSIVIYHGKNGLNGTNGTNGTNGKDGVNGADGHTPVVGVQRDSDGILYWTIDGEWMLDDNGKKIPVTGKDGKDGTNGSNGTNGKDGQDGKDGQNGTDGKDGQNGTNGKDGIDGKDGITPKFKIQDEYWWISYDEGQSWDKLGRATGEKGADGKDGQNGQNGTDGKDGDSIFSSVSQDEYYFYLTLSGSGEKIAIPKNKPFSVSFDRAEFTVQPGKTYKLNFTITGADANTKIVTIEKNGLQAEVFINNVNNGYINVTTPNEMTAYSECELIVLINNGYDRTLMNVFKFVKGVVILKETTYVITSEEQNLSLELTTNLENYNIKIPSDVSWISNNNKTRADLRTENVILSVTENHTTESRSAVLEVQDSNGVTFESINITQNAALIVDLGLSVKWASCNLGANSPEDVGDYFAWGENATKSSFTKDNSKTFNSTLTEYTGNSSYDAARKIMGSNWHTPSQSEIQELINKCTFQSATLNGKKGYKVIGPNNNSIFLPMTGYMSGEDLKNPDSNCIYWSSTHMEASSLNNYRNYGMGFIIISNINGIDPYLENSFRYFGYCIRPVLKN